MRVIASSIRKGNILEIDGQLYTVLTAESFFPGRVLALLVRANVAKEHLKPIEGDGASMS